MAVLEPPVMLFLSASQPVAVLEVPVSFLKSALSPMAVLVLSDDETGRLPY